MYNIFIAIIFLLFLSSCSEDKVKDQEEKPEQVVTENNDALLEETENPTGTESITVQTNLEENRAETVVPEENINQDSAVQEQDKQKNETVTNSSAALIESSVTFNVGKNDIVLGNKESKVVMVEYFSPTCPHCAYYHTAAFPEIKKKYIDTNKIAYVIREFISNKQDLDAAILARCKGDIDSFLQFHKVILEQQDKWAYSNKYRDLLTNIGQIGGISPEVYQQCLSNDKITEILLANTNFVAKAPKFIGTPSFFVNGVQIEQGYTINNISVAIDKALEKDEVKI
ncbi:MULTISPECIES: DsbA family protein [unclassified Rickettsia]|uniref:DsbA family protein n=1 Tax=unclassified Rickettsia TaxID=114295 RepID=UPI0020A0760C|nr:thioredoxin domain-containing protein [Rickettsia endosymbiont of Ceutorhynchus assimilis]